jgi:hypothetical protein
MVGQQVLLYLTVIMLIVGVHSDGRSAGFIIFDCDCMVVAFNAYHH